MPDAPKADPAAKAAAAPKADSPTRADTTTKSSGIVLVGCKLPNGLVLQLDRPGEPRALGNVVETLSVPYGDPITLNGGNTSKIAGGYGITRVPADFWAAWVAQNTVNGTPIFQPLARGLIFAVGNEAAAESESKDRAKLKTGLEGLDPNKPGPKLEPVQG